MITLRAEELPSFWLVFIGEAIEPDAHFPYQNHERGLRFRVLGSFVRSAGCILIKDGAKRR